MNVCLCIIQSLAKLIKYRHWSWLSGEIKIWMCIIDLLQAPSMQMEPLLVFLVPAYNYITSS